MLNATPCLTRKPWALGPSQDYVYCIFKNTSNGNSCLCSISSWIFCPLDDRDLHAEKNNTEMNEKISAFGGIEHLHLKNFFFLQKPDSL